MPAQDQVVVYPIIIEYIPSDSGYSYIVTIPDLDNGMTEGRSIEDAMAMAEDYIGTTSLVEELPPSNYELPLSNVDDIVTLVRVNISEYQRNHQEGVFRQTVTLPDYMEGLAESNGISLSEFLTQALEEEFDV